MTCHHLSLARVKQKTHFPLFHCFDFLIAAPARVTSGDRCSGDATLPDGKLIAPPLLIDQQFESELNMNSDRSEGEQHNLAIRLGDTAVNIAMIRHCVAEHPPTDGQVCGVERDDGFLITALFREGEWLNRSLKPLGFIPAYWFQFKVGR